MPYDEERYMKTLEVGIPAWILRLNPWMLNLQVCALITDLDILEDGDESEIGERGVSSFLLTSQIMVFTMNQVNLSGGQKARGMQTLTSLFVLKSTIIFSLAGSSCVF